MALARPGAAPAASLDPAAEPGNRPDTAPSPGTRASRPVSDILGTRASRPHEQAAEPGERTVADPSPAASRAGASTGRTVAPAPAPAAPATPVAGNPAPRYPRAARRRGIEGRLVLQVLVDTGGTARRVEIFATSGHRLLDEAAVAAVRRWRFVPGQRDGRAAPSVVRVPVAFKLDRAS